MNPHELENLRENLGLEREELAEILEVDRTTIYRWEKGLRKIPGYLKLAMETVERKLLEKNLKPTSPVKSYKTWLMELKKAQRKTVPPAKRD